MGLAVYYLTQPERKYYIPPAFSREKKKNRPPNSRNSYYS